MTVHHFSLVITTASLTKLVCETLLVFLASVMLYLYPEKVFVPKYLCFEFLFGFTSSISSCVLLPKFASDALLGRNHTLSLSTTMHCLEQLFSLHTNSF